MKRPFSSKRPFGPFVSQNKFTELGFEEGSDKEVVGIAGTPYPNYDKEDLLVIYVLEGDHIFEYAKFVNELRRTIESYEGPEVKRISFLESGISSAKQFEEQAVLITISGKELAVTDTQLNMIGGIIVRTSTADVEVKERIYELEGMPTRM